MTHCVYTLRCELVAAINLAIRNQYVHGYMLTNICELIYETGRIQIYSNAIRKVHQAPMPRQSADNFDAEEVTTNVQNCTKMRPTK